MSPKKRLAINKGLPTRWRWDANKSAIWYRVPDKHHHLFDNKKTFRLGSNLTEAHRTFAERIAPDEMAGASQLPYSTMAQLFDKYLLAVTPTKSIGTRKTQIQMIGKLRAVYGDMAPASITPQIIYQVTEATMEATRKRSNGKLTGISTANHRNRILSHVFTMAIRWGAIAKHPMVNKQVVKEPDYGTDRYEPTDLDIDKALPLAPEWLQCYVEIKMRVSLRQTDMLLLQLPQIMDDRVRVKLSKTRTRSAKVLDIKITDDLLYWLDRAAKIKRRAGVVSLFLFHTRDGKPYINLNDYTASSFSSAWDRWQDKWTAAGGTRFQERMLRNKAINDLDLLAAQNLAGHDDTRTTNRYRKTRPIEVVPVIRPVKRLSSVKE